MKLLVIAIALAACARADDGYRLWLRYDPVADPALRQEYAQHFTEIVCPAAVAGRGRPTSAMQAAVAELERGARGMLGAAVPVVPAPDRDGAIVLIGNQGDRLRDGYALRSVARGHRAILISSGRDAGVLYGAFALLRRMQLGESLRDLNTGSMPRYARRIIDHWDNLDGTIERGYAGRSLWKWSELPGQIDPRYVDYARAEASIGVNGTVLNNVNADARIL
ncbi:MAG TPA: alpha-glucuronidase family glycosyl hydrolase, partial [Opitutaceae bacterium]|nr:alpha-glucuronidase family glycosyl hydrolase [Opitutaceae bacterium]